ncbi:MAG: VTT domain-containing protein [Opitutales bacterium]|nr:VTT domain-containing protein [Opitutales bacterium]
MLNKIRQNKLKIALAAAALFALIFLYGVFLWHEEIFSRIKDFSIALQECAEGLNDMPLAVFPIAVFLLPIFALPVTPVYFLAGGRGENICLIIFVCALGLFANIIFSYFISKKFSDFFREKLARRGIRVPSVPRDEHYDIVFLLRMIPGNPLAVQNYFLGVAGVDFKPYIMLSLPIQFVQLVAYIYFSDGILHGDAANFMLGVSLLGVIAVIARIVQKRVSKRNGISQEKR